MQGIILAGGLGTRLQAVVKNLPKPMADINGRPFLELLLENLAQKGFKSVTLALGYKAECIKEYFKDEFKGLRLLYSIEEERLGTGGALKLALEQCEAKEIFVYNGDTFFNINPSNLSLDKHSKIALALKKMPDTNRYGRVLLDEKGFILGFEEKGMSGEGLINGGVYKIQKNLFEGFKFTKNFSFELFLQEHFKALKAKAFCFDEYFIDIGVPQDYEKMRRDFASHQI